MAAGTSRSIAWVGSDSLCSKLLSLRPLGRATARPGGWPAIALRVLTSAAPWLRRLRAAVAAKAKRVGLTPACDGMTGGERRNGERLGGDYVAAEDTARPVGTERYELMRFVVDLVDLLSAAQGFAPEELVSPRTGRKLGPLLSSFRQALAATEAPSDTLAARPAQTWTTDP